MRDHAMNRFSERREHAQLFCFVLWAAGKRNGWLGQLAMVLHRLLVYAYCGLKQEFKRISNIPAHNIYFLPCVILYTNIYRPWPRLSLDRRAPALSVEQLQAHRQTIAVMGRVYSSSVSHQVWLCPEEKNSAYYAVTVVEPAQST